MAHFSPYTSKWNPVEHRLFPHITRSLKGVILKSHDYVKELIENTTTLTGLKVKAHIIKKIYKIDHFFRVLTLRTIYQQSTHLIYLIFFK